MLFGPWGCCIIVLVLLKYLTRVMDMQIDIAVFHELEREFHLFIFKRPWYCLLQFTKRVQFLLQIPFNRLSNSLYHDYVSYAVLNYAMWFFDSPSLSYQCGILAFNRQCFNLHYTLRGLICIP